MLINHSIRSQNFIFSIDWLFWIFMLWITIKVKVIDSWSNNGATEWYCIFLMLILSKGYRLKVDEICYAIAYSWYVEHLTWVLFICIICVTRVRLYTCGAQVKYNSFSNKARQGVTQKFAFLLLLVLWIAVKYESVQSLSTSTNIIMFIKHN